MKVTVEKSTLPAHLDKNRIKHVERYEAAVKVYGRVAARTAGVPRLAGRAQRCTNGRDAPRWSKSPV